MTSKRETLKFKPNTRKYKTILLDGSSFVGKWSFFKKSYNPIIDSVKHPFWLLEANSKDSYK
jgi:hypothetical protein